MQCLLSVAAATMTNSTDADPEQEVTHPFSVEYRTIRQKIFLRELFSKLLQSRLGTLFSSYTVTISPTGRRVAASVCGV